MLKIEQYIYLSILSEKEVITTKDFSTERKSAIYISEALSVAPRCKICSARVHRNSISIDHAIRKQDGGLGSTNNGQLTHPYCNSGFKN